MFGNSENQMEHMVKKHQWDKVNRKLDGADVKTKLAAAAACGASDDENAENILIQLLQDGDKSVLLEAVQALGRVGSKSAKTHLQWLSEHLSEGDGGLREEIHNAMAKISQRE